MHHNLYYIIFFRKSELLPIKNIMRNKIFIIFILLLLNVTFIQAESTNASFTAIAYIPQKLPTGVLSASITPLVIKSNQQIKIIAITEKIPKTEKGPTNVKVYFKEPFEFIQELTNISVNKWGIEFTNRFKNQSSYTANFIVMYTNFDIYTDIIITNYNMASYRVDNTAPEIISSTPSNNAFIVQNNWDFYLYLQDTGGAGVDTLSTISNSMMIFAGDDEELGTSDDTTNDGTWSEYNSTTIKFEPVEPSDYGKYRVISLPVDNVGNTNFEMTNESNYIEFIQIDELIISSVYHKFELNTQLTPEVPLEVYLKGTGGIKDAYFEVTGCTNINNIEMSEISNGTYQGVYTITKEDKVQDGIVRAYLKDKYQTKSLDAPIKIDIGERVYADRGKDIFIVNKDDVNTKILIPDKSLREDVKVNINKVYLFGDRYSYDFSMTTYENGIPVEYFEKPITIYIHYTVNEGKVEKLNIKEDKLEDLATIMFFDRVKWLKVGGFFDLEKDIVYGNVKHFSVFALAIDDSKGELVVAPNPFTPNNDNSFDRICFGCDIKQGEPEKVEIKVFSLDGFLRKELTLDDGILNNGRVNILWDGKDESNQDCGQGLYIYQAQIGNTRYQGTFVLAR